MKRAVLVLTVFAVIAGGGAAFAHNGPGARLKCRDDGTGAVFGWVKGGDSPVGDENIAALRFSIDAGQYAYCFNMHTGIEGIPVGSVRNLSYNFLEPQETGGGTVVGGSPRISVILTSGDVVFLDTANCNDPLERTEGRWGRSDFTGQLGAGDCTLYYNGVEPFTSTGTDSAWQLFAEAHPTLVVDYAFFIVDQPGKYRIDLLAFQDHMWTRSGYQRVVHCPTEASC